MAVKSREPLVPDKPMISSCFKNEYNYASFLIRFLNSLYKLDEKADQILFKADLKLFEIFKCLYSTCLLTRGGFQKMFVV